MPQTTAQLRRVLAKRMQMWGGDISSGLAGTTTAVGAADGTTLVDTTREELDEEWDSAYVVLNPGTANAVWRRIVALQGFTESNGVMRVSPGFPNQVASGTSYEVFKVFKPNDWLDSLNYAINEAFPAIHRRVDFELAMDPKSRVVDLQYLLFNSALAAPTSAPTVTNISALSIGGGTPTFPAGTWTVGYTFYNDLGETLLSPTTTVTTLANQAIDIAAIVIPTTVAAMGVKYYCSFEAGSTILGRMDTLQGSLLVSAPAGTIPGLSVNGTVPEIQFPNPPPVTAQAVPAYNTTAIDFIQIHRIQVRSNPGSGPEIWQDLGGHLWTPLGDNSFQINFLPLAQFNLRVIGLAVKPNLSAETDSTDIPLELLMWGAEKYLWWLTTKASTIVNVNWEKLEATAESKFERLKAMYQTTPPGKVKHRPNISTRS